MYFVARHYCIDNKIVSSQGEGTVPMEGEDVVEQTNRTVFLVKVHQLPMRVYDGRSKIQNTCCCVFLVVLFVAT